MFNWFKKNKDKAEEKQEDHACSEQMASEGAENAAPESSGNISDAVAEAQYSASAEKEEVTPEKEAAAAEKEEVTPEKEAVTPESEVVAAEKVATATEKEVVASEKEAAAVEKEVAASEENAAAPAGRAYADVHEEPLISSKTQKKKPGFFSKFFGNLFKNIDDDFYDDLEELLIEGDMGVAATEELLDNLRDEVTRNKSLKTSGDAKAFLIEDIKRLMRQPEGAYDFENEHSVVMLIGVNGVGKTTCAGKIAKLYSDAGKKVILAGADTFRAAATEQLKVWAERSGCYLVAGAEGADPGSVVYDASSAAKARCADILLCDTAGRLHNKKNLMNELAKLDKIFSGQLPDYKRENIIVLDATTGQNALQQAKEFGEVMNIDGVILTKLDGTAKGGIAVAITRELNVPVKYIGVGEGIGDLRRFESDSFVDSLFES